eukprot:gene14450-19500_t
MGMEIFRSVLHGLKQGIGSVIDLKVYLTKGEESNGHDVSNIQKWMACGGDVTRTEDPHYYFYRVGACAWKSGTTIESCIKKTKVPASDGDILERIQNCTKDSARAKRLVTAMNDKGSIVQKICSEASSRNLAVNPE